MQVSELAGLLNLVFEGDGEVEITSAAPLESAGVADLSFVGSRKAATQAHLSLAGCLLIAEDAANLQHRTVLRAANPRMAFAAALRLLYPQDQRSPGIHPSAIIASTARVDATASIGPYVTVAERARIGPRTSVGAGTSVGESSEIGSDCMIHERVSLYSNVTVGNRVVLHSGVVLGADGFGFVLNDDHYEKFPQVGRVVVGSDVEIGANSCIDRAALGVTEIGDGTKLDNLVHVGHNCRIGKHVVIAAQTGLSGGVVIGDYAVVGGQVGVGDKARIESKAVIGSKAGILPSKIVRAGEPQWGVPARPLREHLRTLAFIARASRKQPQ